MRNHLKIETLGVTEVRFYYLRSDRDGDATVCLLKVVETGTGKDIYARGIAFCEPEDQFVKRVGRDIALGRAIQAIEHQGPSNKIPEDPMEHRIRLRRQCFEYLSEYQVQLTALESYHRLRLSHMWACRGKPPWNSLNVKDGKMETKQVKLRDNPFLLELTGSSMTYQGESPDKVITIAAVEGEYGDWAAYMETPESGKCVAEYGSKLPQTAAEELFPDWAKCLRWRP